jgi:hypothetical protein
MAFLDDIGTYLAAASTPTQALTVGTNLFLGRRPDTPDTCVTVYETGGTAPELVFGTNSAPPVETRGLQVVVRGTSYATSEALCTEVWTALCLIDNEVIGTRRYLLADPVQSPFALDRDDRNRMLHVCNFLVSREV